MNYTELVMWMRDMFPQADDILKKECQPAQKLKEFKAPLSPKEAEMANKFLSVYADYCESHSQYSEDMLNELYFVYLNTIRRLTSNGTSEEDFKPIIKNYLCQAAYKIRKANEPSEEEDDGEDELNFSIAIDHSASIINKILVRDVIEYTPLTAREKDIVLLYFGFNDQPMTLADLAKHYGVTSERIRQLLKHALRKMRMSIRCMNYRKASHD